MISAPGLLCLLYIGNAVGWTYTEYLTTYPSTDQLFGTTKIITQRVTPTGNVSPTSTNITTTSAEVGFAGYIASFNVTVTDLFVGSNALVCALEGFAATCSPVTTTASNSIQTTWWAPVTITNPPTCTDTSFVYTTSSKDTLFTLGGVLFDTSTLTTLFDQATQTGPGGEALFVTTYVSTISVDLGGQPVTTTNCHVYLKSGVLDGLGPDLGERSYLSQCVDPRRYLCGSQSVGIGGCGTDWVGTYPQTVTASASASSSVVGLASTSAAKTNGIAGREYLLFRGQVLMAVILLTLLFIVGS
jgi:hypothetical protein